MKKIFYLYRTKRRVILINSQNGKGPDHFLYGFNYFNRWGVRAEFSDIAFSKLNLIRPLFIPLEILLIKLSSFGFNLSQIIMLLPKLLKVDIIVSTIDGVGLPLLLIKKTGILRARVIYISIGFANELYKRRNNWISKLYLSLISETDVIVCHSNAEKKTYQNLNKKLNAKTKVIPFGIDYNFFNSKHKKGSFILSIGRDRSRNFGFLCKIAEKFANEQFVVISSENLVRKIAFPSNVKVYIDLDYNDVLAYYKKAKLVFLPLFDLNRAAGQVTFLESIATGNKIVVSNIKGLRDIYTNLIRLNKKHIYFYKPGNFEDATKALNFALNSKHKQKLRFLSEFTSENYAKKLFKLIKELY